MGGDREALDTKLRILVMVDARWAFWDPCVTNRKRTSRRKNTAISFCTCGKAVLINQSTPGFHQVELIHQVLLQRNRRS